ncbi:MAG: ribonuclease HII [Alphaproteobacteria bacterium]|nr:ribonuclease HII [Alphaproteobacteria bacterium]
MTKRIRVLGLDEAGRGCVLGDLCVGAFYVEDPDDTVLRAAGADDSKRLSEKKREAAREALASLGEGRVERITPGQIDAANLNQLELEAIAGLVREFRPDHVFMDALGPPKTVPTLVQKLQAMVGRTCSPVWTIEPKADHTYAVVGAASIFAKTTRDRALADLDAAHGPLGSGYPSDPVTKAWLGAWAAKREPWPHFVRTRWQTIVDLGQQTLL